MVMTGTTSTALMRYEPPELAEILRERLVDAAWVVNAHGYAAQSDEREAHGDPVVVVRVDHRRLQLRRWSDPDLVRPLVDHSPHLAQLGRHRGQSIGLLHSPARHVPYGGWTVGEQREHCSGHGRIR